MKPLHSLPDSRIHSLSHFLTSSFTIFLILLFTNSLTHAQGNSLLWRITGNNLTKPSYLYGTMHTRDARAFHFADSVLAAFETCDAFAMEVIINDEVKTKIGQSIFMDSSFTLKNFLTATQYDSVDQFSKKKLGQSIQFYERLKPIYTCVLFTENSFEENDSMHEKKKEFLDLFFETEARNQQKKISGLETAEEQLHVFDLLSYKDQASLLMKTIREEKADTFTFESMIGYYMNNDLFHMMQFENDYDLPDSLFDALITNRNHHMADRIDTMIQRRSTFIAIGAGHLGGDEGVVSLLREKGYTVVPVIPSFKNYLDNGWIQFVSEKNHFTVQLPQYPSLIPHENKMKYSATNDDDNYKIVCSNAADATLEDKLEQWLQDVLECPAAKTEIKNKNDSTIEFEITIPGPRSIHLTGAAHFANGNWCVCACNANKKNTERFLHSFQWIN